MHQLETVIGYTFEDPKLLETALTHTSYANESKTPIHHNERLEFLGDSVLSIVVADHLFHQWKDRPEGELTSARASLVRERPVRVCQGDRPGALSAPGPGEERGGGRTRPSVVGRV